MGYTGIATGTCSPPTGLSAWSRLPPLQDPEPTSSEVGVPISGTVGGRTLLPAFVMRVTTRCL